MRRRKAFTLVELLTVVGIVAVLISILLPSLARAREAANRIKCSANLRQWYAAVLLYHNDFKCLPGPLMMNTVSPEMAARAGLPFFDPAFPIDSQPAARVDFHKSTADPRLLWAYLGKSNALFACPSSDDLYTLGTPANAASPYAGKCFGYGYRFNNQWDTLPAFFFGYWGTDPAYTKVGTNASPKRLTSIRAAVDARVNNAVVGVGKTSPADVWMMSDVDGDVFGVSDFPDFGLPDTYRESHRAGWARGRNYLFFDGHVQFCVTSDAADREPANPYW